MSYGVIASKAAQVQVDQVGATGGVLGAPGASGRAGADDHSPSRGRRRARATEPALWGSGRLTLTSLHLTFVPASGSSGVHALTIALADIVAIETSGGGRGGPGAPRGKVILFRTADVVLRARLAGASSFARQVATSVESNRKRSATHPQPLEPDDSRLSPG